MLKFFLWALVITGAIAWLFLTHWLGSFMGVFMARLIHG